MLGNIKQNLFRSWIELGIILGLDNQEVERVWKIFTSFYEQKHRHYHNFQHLSNMFALAEDVNTQISDPTSFHLAIWFHDLVYKPTKKNNELMSARNAKKLFELWHLPQEKIDSIVQLILSTAKHFPENDGFDNKLFLDIDLAILGSEPDIYRGYIQAIRQEYRIYPDPIYKFGRKKILLKFLARPQIYFSDIFFDRLERQARTNIEAELRNLN